MDPDLVELNRCRGEQGVADTIEPLKAAGIKYKVGSTAISFDISKIGIAKAAVKDKDSTYVVGSVFNVPVEDNSIDLLLNIFAPLHLEELKRVLKTGGYFIKVIPTGDHMKEVAELVYKKFIPHQSSIQKDIESDSMFRIVKVENLKRND